MKKREILDDIYYAIVDLQRDILDIKKQLNDVTSWQLRSMIPKSTPKIPVKPCSICEESKPGISGNCEILNCPFKENYNF